MENFISLLSKLNLISTSYANTIEDTPINMNAPSTTVSSGLGSFVLSIIVFFIFIAILGYLFILLNKKNEQQAISNKSFTLLDKVKLDHNSNLFVVEIHNSIHVIGKSDSSMIHVTEFTELDDINIIKSDCLKKKEVTFQNVIIEQLEQMTGNQKLKSTSSKAFKFNRKGV